MSNKARNTGKKPKDDESQTSAENAENKDDGIKAIVWGFFISLFITILPLNLIIRGIVGLALMLVRPVLLFLGVVKDWEEVERRRK